MSFDLELTGRRALVTAGTKGIGAAVVEVLHNDAATVVATARARFPLTHPLACTTSPRT